MSFASARKAADLNGFSTTKDPFPIDTSAVQDLNSCSACPDDLAVGLWKRRKKTMGARQLYQGSLDWYFLHCSFA